MVTLKKFSLAPLGAILMTLGTVSAAQAATFYGETKSLGQGFISSYVTLDDITGKPLDIGVAFTEGALSLSTDPDDPGAQIELALPSEASSTVFSVINVDYRTRGYPPNPEVFNVPNFRISYFVPTSEERDQICPNPDTSTLVATCVGEEKEKAAKAPEEDAIPEGYVQFPTADAFYAQPRYGSGVYNPNDAFAVVTGQEPLTSLSNYGIYDGEINSVQLLVVKDYLESQPSVTKSLSQPKTYAETGYFPTEYSINFDQTTQNYKVSLGGLTYRTVPEPSAGLGLLGLGLWAAVLLGKNLPKKLGQN
ncbi:DUF5602 domain-containing protein [Cylindrospermum sp. FACHB-282]|uniref:DUF5602 domain-containing protein n=1 Tax=Cylindrospermum sp. FACHB-282 TaxID=2692794 RepID=UPI001682B200|nr:DUF5602 domain-containing protein [Cylindrospermum sp. FACHB-282]MBD2385495.1 DUF5602 domain-containing protein [Cylindrospermum sp. FACHB-282]